MSSCCDDRPRRWRPLLFVAVALVTAAVIVVSELYF